MLIAPFPLRVGNSWKVERDSNPVTFAIVGWEDIKVDGKTYQNCLRIHETSSDGEEVEFWYGPTVGMIKMENRRPVRMKMVRTLREFKPGNPTLNGKNDSVRSASFQAQDEANAAQDAYFPLAIGQETTLADTGDSQYEIHTNIVAMVEKNGKSYFRSREWRPNTPGEFTELLRKDEHALYSVDEGLHSTEQVKFTLPLKVGSTGQRSYGRRTEKYAVITLETVEIAGKTYENCYHIQTIVTDARVTYTVDSWEAPHVGTVKSITTDRNGRRSTEVLKEFKPGK